MQTSVTHYFFEPGLVKTPTTEQMEHQGMMVLLSGQILAAESKEQLMVQL
jgi:hypothetical protein